MASVSPMGAHTPEHAFVITPSDSADFGIAPRAIYVGGAGVVAVVLMDNTVVNYTVPAGGRILVRSKRVNSTNTTATLLVGEA